MKISIYNVQEEPIGCGGMGRVYLGTDPKGNVVAIKEMLAQYVVDANLRARFHQEASILTQLEHQYIVKMYASFEEHGNLYLVMEYVEGETVEQYVKRKGMISETEAISLLTDILSALRYAHQKGYVHRDIKPGNIIIRPNGKICLLDFGIAKNMSVSSNGLTVGRLTIGTNGYMSPEQAEGLSIDQRSDIYSLGCVLFYMLTGIQGTSPKVKGFNPNLSDNIQRLLERATDKNMLRRFQSCREFELELSSGKTVSENNSVLSVGRESCDINISHPKVSRHHLDIEVENVSEGTMYIFRDRSTNGTVIDGQKVHNDTKNILISRQDEIKPSVLLSGEVELKWEWIENTPHPELSTSTPEPVEEKQKSTGWLRKALLIGIILLGIAAIVWIIASIN